MSDLRGQQLKDSYQNVVTRGTGNKLENGNGVEFADLDDKASLSGANFTDMPLVDGSPIVERDSNDDGEWARFADGTQFSGILDILLSHNNSQVLRNDWEYPKDFLERPIVIPSGGINSESRPNSNEGWFSCNEGAGALYSNTRVRIFLGGSSGTFSSGDTASVNAIAKGRWK